MMWCAHSHYLNLSHARHATKNVSGFGWYTTIYGLPRNIHKTIGGDIMRGG